MAAPKKPLGAKSDKLWRGALLLAVKRRLEGKGSPQQLERMADKCVERAVKGDMVAAKEVGDRLDGRPVQGVEFGVAVRITRIERHIVAPKALEAPVIEGHAVEVPASGIGNGVDASE